MKMMNLSGQCSSESSNSVQAPDELTKNQTRKQKLSKQQALIPTTTSLHRNDLPAQGHNGTRTKNGFGKASKTMSYEFSDSPTMER